MGKTDILGLKDMGKEEILSILACAEKMKKHIRGQKSEILKECSVTTLFYENSTRTKMSFNAAGQYLGAKVSDLEVGTSSIKKGESLIDTATTLDHMGSDVIILRHGSTGAPHLIAREVKASVINAGDGCNEHPTQALLDLLTIKEKKKNFEGLKVVIIGDIAHSRVARSNIYGLTKLGAKVIVAGPSTLVPGSMRYLGAEVTYDIAGAIQDADVVMGLRVQLERQKGGLFPDLKEYATLFGINEELIKLAKDDVMIMHPGPVNRGVEMTNEVVDHVNSHIGEQVENGVAIRMALLAKVTGKGWVA